MLTASDPARTRPTTRRRTRSRHHVNDTTPAKSRISSQARRLASAQMPLDPARGQSWAVLRRRRSAELQGPDDERPPTSVRLEELEHPGVVAARLAGQRPGHDVRQVEVADADGIRIAERPDGDLGGRPRPDPGHGPEPRVRGLERQVDDRLEPVGARRRPRGRRPPAAARRRTGGTRSRGGEPASPASAAVEGAARPGRRPARPRRGDARGPATRGVPRPR